MGRKTWPWKKKSEEGEEEKAAGTSTTGQTHEELRCEEELAAASKEDMVKQQEKLLEEAVSGWENAQAEAATSKHELEATIAEKVELKSNLDECRRELQLAREEIDKVKSEKSLLFTSYQDLLHSKKRNQDELRTIEMKLEIAEKDKSRLKYELHLLNKEIEIRSEEREHSMKAAEASHMQYLENVRKIAQLQSECQRLRGLVGKKGRNISQPASRSSLTKLCPSSPDSNKILIDHDLLQLSASKLPTLKSPRHSHSRHSVDNASSVASTAHMDENNEDEMSCAESWASALLAELDDFKKAGKNEQSSDNFVILGDIVQLIHSEASRLHLETGKLVQAKEEITHRRFQGNVTAQLLHFLQELFTLLSSILSHANYLNPNGFSDQEECDSMSNLSSCHVDHLKSMKRANSSISSTLKETGQMVEDTKETKAQLQSRIKDSEMEIDKLHQQIDRLNKELESEQKQHRDLETLHQELLTDIQKLRDKKTIMETSEAQDEHEKVKKEVEVEVTKASEKLVKCQQTIQILGTQLKALSSSDEALSNMDNENKKWLWQDEEERGIKFISKASPRPTPITQSKSKAKAPTKLFSRLFVCRK